MREKDGVSGTWVQFLDFVAGPCAKSQLVHWQNSESLPLYAPVRHRPCFCVVAEHLPAVSTFTGTELNFLTASFLFAPRISRFFLLAQLSPFHHLPPVF
jgi:hypothetical protein